MELRKDYVLDRWVIVATNRAKRPKTFKEEKVDEDKKIKCPFCPGNEALTPPEIGRVKDKNGNWKVRWFENKYRAVEEKGNPVIRTDNTFFTFADAFGRHEVIVETPEHNKDFSEFKPEHIKEILKVYSNRIEELSTLNGVKYVQVFKNHGKEGGASIDHEHSQVIALNKIPFWVEEKIKARLKFGFCPYCKIIEIEKGSYRRVFESDNFVSFTPYASRFPFEIWVFPKAHIRKLSELDDEKLLELSVMLKKIIKKIKELGTSYNYMLYYSPEDSDLHFHIEIIPRTSVWAGMEFSGVIINTTSPEDAAKFYRGELKLKS